MATWRRDAPRGWPAWRSWGVQLTVGHFQIQMWTAGLVLLTGLWRILIEGQPKARAAGVVRRPGLGRGGGLDPAPPDLGADRRLRVLPRAPVPEQLPVPAFPLGAVGLAGGLSRGPRRICRSLLARSRHDTRRKRAPTWG